MTSFSASHFSHTRHVIIKYYFGTALLYLSILNMRFLNFECVDSFFFLNMQIALLIIEKVRILKRRFFLILWCLG